MKAARSSPIASVPPPKRWDREADVVVVGTGGGGLAATARVAEGGSSVITIDKSPEDWVGGGTKQALVFITFGGTRYQNAARFALPTFPFDPDALVQYMLPHYNYSVDSRLLRELAVKGAECVDWMGDCGVLWSLDPLSGPTGHIWEGADEGGFIARGMKPITDHMYSFSLRQGAQFSFRTELQALVQDGKRVIGVKCRTDKGTLYLRARRGVVLAAGGFANNREMLKKYIPQAYAGAACSYAMPSDTGEAIRMGIGLGADIAGLGSSVSFDGGVDWLHEQRGSFYQYLYNGSTQLARQPWLGVDISGKRYPFLDAYPGGFSANVWQKMDSQAIVLMSQPGGRGYVIFDHDYEAHILRFKQVGCRKPITPDMPNLDRMPTWVAPHDWREGARLAIEKGVIKRANSIEELGELLNFEPGVLSASVRRWNETCEAGVDSELHFPPEWLIPVLKPPFYGIRIGANLFATKCGLRVNTKMQVLNTKQQVIPGLYAAFHTAGGAVGENASSLGGILHSAGLSWTSGYIAGCALTQSIANSEPSGIQSENEESLPARE
ncbi:MAG TPA: FAD-binding protein [Candidatus Saccharimonadales bacterium]|nr:FAD-binding protein [Candidatus Saccharimonadales bacterium]